MPDWDAMFSPSAAIAEVIARASIMYLFLFFALRFLLKREGGQVNIADLLVATVISWSQRLNWLSWRFEALKWLTAAKPVALIENGRFCRANMRRAPMAREQLMQPLREESVEDVGQVRHAVVEGDGEVSVIKYEDA